MKNKSRELNIFGGMNFVSINGTRVNSSNIKSFKLILDQKIDKTQYYKVNKDDDNFFIYHDLDTGKVDWVESKD